MGNKDGITLSAQKYSKRTQPISCIETRRYVYVIDDRFVGGGSDGLSLGSKGCRSGGAKRFSVIREVLSFVCNAIFASVSLLTHQPRDQCVI